MRIAVVAACPFPSPQGSQVFVGEMCEALARRGHEVELLTYGQGEERATPPTSYAHRRIRRLPGDDAMRSGPTIVKPLLNLLLVRHLSRMLARERFDVVHAHNYEAGAVAVLVRTIRHVPVVYHSHSVMAEELPSYFANPAAKQCARVVGASFDRTLPRSADHVIALSADCAAAMRSAGVADDDLSVLPPALADIGRGPPREAARASLGVAADRFVLGYCGNLDAYQDLHVVAAAVARMGAAQRASAPLWLVVTHARDARFERMLEYTGAAQWTTVVLARSFAEVRSALAASDVLVLPRRAPSGFPIKLLNYMAAGRVTLAGSAGARLMTAGVIAAGERPDDWAAALEGLRANPASADRMGEAARARFLSTHTWDAALPALERVYDRVIGRGKATSTVVPVLR